MVKIGIYRWCKAISFVEFLECGFFMRSEWFSFLVVVVPFFLMGATLVSAQSGDVGQIVEPLNRIYDLVKAAVSVVGMLVLTFAGAKFMFSGDNLQARENSKSMVSYAVMGLVLVWVAPLLVSYLTA